MIKYLKHTSFALLFIIAISSTVNAQHFTAIWLENPWTPMSIVVQEATINGSNMEAGDEIAVFDIGDGGARICVGTFVLSGELSPSNIAMIIASQDEVGGGINGFTPGHSIIFRLWDVSDSAEILITLPFFDISFDTVYQTLGTALITSLEGSTAVETTVEDISSCQGNKTVPITVKNMFDVAEFSITLNYDTNNITYQGYQNANSQLANGALSVVEDDDEITISWTSSSSANITSDTLIEINYFASTVYNQTYANINWDDTNSYYVNSNSTTLEKVFHDGQFVIYPLPVNADSLTGSNIVCQGSLSVQYQVVPIDNAITNVWSITPDSAGIINGSENNITIDFSDNYSGQATLSVYGSNPCGDGIATNMSIDVVGIPIVNIGSDTSICEYNTITLTPVVSNVQSTIWTTNGDGSFDSPDSLNVTYTPGVDDKNNGSVVLSLTATSQTPCTTSISDNITLTLYEAPIVTAGIYDTIQIGDSTTLLGNVVGGTLPYYFQWSPQNSLNSSVISNPIASPDTTTIYSLIVGDSNFCVGNDSVLITVTHFMHMWNGDAYFPMRVIVTSATINEVELNVGDEIALFETDSAGGEICVGYAIVSKPIISGDPLIIIASSDNPNTTILDGFTMNNTINYKAWSNNQQNEYSTYQVNYNTGFDSIYSILGTAMVDISFLSAITQNIILNQGWNLLSFYVAPDSMDLLNIVDSLVISNQLVKIVNESGGIIQEIPNTGWLNTIGDMENTEGYYMKVINDTVLNTIGNVVSLPFEILLQTGWNLMGYPSQSSEDSYLTLQTLISDSTLVKVISESGNFIQFIPGVGWMNTIGDFAADEGYYIKTNANSAVTIGIKNPVVITDSVVNLTSTSLSTGGIVLSDGGSDIIERGICWSTTPTPTIYDSTITAGTGTGVFVVNINNLEGAVRYYFRAYAKNIRGTSYGNHVTVKTPWVCGFNITDSRDDQTYNTIQIGNQCWMAENLNIGTRIDGTSNQTDNSLLEKYCYNNDVANCDTYGGLYQWNEMMQYTMDTTNQGICPSGWHLPTDSEWKILEGEVDTYYKVGNSEWDAWSWRGFDIGNNLKSTTGWYNEGNNISGFNALAAGIKYEPGNFAHLGSETRWWTTREVVDTLTAMTRYFNSAWPGEIYRGHDMNTRGISVRCMKNMGAQLETNQITNLTDTTATTGGFITYGGGASIDERGVCWGTSSSPTKSDNYTSDGTGIGIFESIITGLLSNTQYYVRAFAINDTEISYGNEITFFTSKPIVITNDIINPTDSNAICGGNAITDGGHSITAKGVCWSTVTNPTINDSITLDGDSTGLFVSNLVGLNSNTQYYVRAYATNSMGTSYGPEKYFITHSICGNEMTDFRDNQTYSTVIIGDQCWMSENINSGTKINLAYVPSDNDTIEKYCYNNTESNCDTYGGLYAWDEMMQYTDNEGSKGVCPYGWHVPTDEEFKILEGTVDSQFGVGDPEWDDYNGRGFDVGKRLKTTAGWSSNTGTDYYGFSALPGGYSYKGGSFNQLGQTGYWWVSTIDYDNGGYYKETYSRYIHHDRDFVDRYANQSTNGFSVRCLRNSNLTLVTDSVTNISQFAAISGGQVSSEGGAPITARGVCYSTGINPTINDYYTSDGTGEGIFTSELYNLTPSTKYFVRAYATNSSGTTYGNQLSFTTTLAIIATTNTTIATNISQNEATSGGVVSENGGEPVIARGVCWSTSQHPSISDSHSVDGYGEGSFISSLTGLLVDSIYYYRSYATNSVGTVYGNERSIKTISGCGGIIADTRDNSTYGTVIIGTQCWLNENLNYAIGSSICYNNADSNCAVYGRMYNWATLMNGGASSNTNPSGVQGICPVGWHVPSLAEYDQLVACLDGDTIAGGKLKEVGTSHWNSPNVGATNQSNFNGLPGGGYYSGNFGQLGQVGSFWTTMTAPPPSYNYLKGSVTMYNSNDDISKSHSNSSIFKSARCVKD